MNDFGWLSVVPPIAAILLAIFTRRVVLSLACGLVAGVLIWRDWEPLAAASGLAVMLRESLASYDGAEKSWDVDHIKVLMFTLIMGAMVGTVHQNGGMSAVANGVATWAHNRRRGQMATWMLGLIVFIDDYANSLLLGNTMRPVTDRLRISREKLAYLVDSTAAPVSGMALISTWVAGEMSYIRDGLAQVESLPDIGFAEGSAVSAFNLFVMTIPTRFYVVWALLFVPIVAWMQRDFGPMLTAERRALGGQVSPVAPINPSEKPAVEGAADDEDPHIDGHWAAAVVPIVVTVLVTIVWLVISGLRSTGDSFSVLGSLTGWVDTIGDAVTSDALMLGALAGWIIGLAAGAHRGWTPLLQGSLTGARHVIPACFILWMAWTMGDLTDGDHLQTAAFLASGLTSVVAAWALPTVVFLLASFVAFSTGTSWGTMGILMPIVIPTAVQVIANGQAGGPAATISGSDPILVSTIAAVLAGAIWGDHCSPISDTTVLSSAATRCDHIAHVRTQMPYALLVGGVSIVCGTLLIGLGVPVWITHILGIGTLIAVLRLVGKPV
jgi:Na+/H+ antiporter NhaC